MKEKYEKCVKNRHEKHYTVKDQPIGVYVSIIGLTYIHRMYQ